jgi:hypothetical protein
VARARGRRVVGERAAAIHVHLMRQDGIDRAGGIAHDRGEVNDGVAVLEGALARLGIPDVAADDLDAALLEPAGEALLTVEEHVENARLVAGGHELLHHAQPDISRASGNEDSQGFS